jgi:hypothetical protein
MPCVSVPAFLPALQAAWPFNSKQCRTVPGSLLIQANVAAPICRAAVPAVDVTLSPVVTDNLPVIRSLTACVYPDDGQAVSNVVSGTTVYYDAPLYPPFDTDVPTWWDNLVAKELQARRPMIIFASRGTLITNSTETKRGDIARRRPGGWRQHHNPSSQRCYVLPAGSFMTNGNWRQLS